MDWGKNGFKIEIHVKSFTIIYDTVTKNLVIDLCRFNCKL